MMSLEMRQKQVRVLSDAGENPLATEVIVQTLLDVDLVPEFGSTDELVVDFLTGFVSEPIAYLQATYQFTEADASKVLYILDTYFAEFKY